MPVCNVQILITVAVKIERRATPAPAGARQQVVVGRLTQTLGTAKEQAIAVAQFQPMLLMTRKVLATQAHVLQPTRGGGPHPGHVEIQMPIPVKVRQRMRHAKAKTVLTQRVGHISKPALTIIEVHV